MDSTSSLHLEPRSFRSEAKIRNHLSETRYDSAPNNHLQNETTRVPIFESLHQDDCGNRTNGLSNSPVRSRLRPFCRVGFIRVLYVRSVSEAIAELCTISVTHYICCILNGY